MNCPVCETQLKTPRCDVCKTEFNSAEFNKLRQLAYLLRATNDWTPENLVERRTQYIEANARFREQAFATQRAQWHAQQHVEPPDIVAEAPDPASDNGQQIADNAHSPQPTFEQWLFSENTIKTALYSGAFLLILAGLIFVGANWSNLPGYGKLGVTLATTALMCGAGFTLLLRSQTLRIGGLALIGIAGGFAPLNFYVIDEYLLDIDEATIWLIGSIICTLFYIWLLRQTQSAILGAFMAVGVVSGQLALYALLDADGAIMATLLMLLPVTLLAIALQWRELAHVFRPTYTFAHFLAFFIYAGILMVTVFTDTRSPGEWYESHGWLVVAVLIGCAFYIINFRAIASTLSEYVTAVAFMGASLALTTHLVNIYIINRNEVRGDDTTLGIAFAVLMAVYLAAGFARPRYRWWLHGSGVLLSLLAFAWTWEEPQIATIILLVIAAAYMVAAMQYQYAPLILPGLLAIYLAVWAFWQIGDGGAETALIVSYAGLGVFLIGLGRWFRTRHKLTALLLLVAGGTTLLAAFVVSISAENLWLAVALSIIVALIAIALTWLEKEWLLAHTFGNDKNRFSFPGFLTVIATLAIFIGHFNLMAATSDNQDGTWPLITIALSAIFVVISWLLRDGTRHQLFGLPLNGTAFLTMTVPFVASFEFDWWVVAVVCGVIGLIAIADGWLRRAVPMRHYQILLGIGFLIGTLWAVLAQYEVEETQWYALPLGVTLLLIGWGERIREHTTGYLLFTMTGLLVLFGSALDQSFDEVRYAILLFCESILAIVIGVRGRSRAYVQLGLLALIVNGIVQYGPAFANLPRFVQIGSVGSTLLILGMLALFRREQLISTRDALRNEWREWHA